MNNYKLSLEKENLKKNYFRIVSKDTPNWCQLTNKFYTPENFDISKNAKNKFVRLPKADIIGNLLVKRPKEDRKFNLSPPYKGMRSV